MKKFLTLIVLVFSVTTPSLASDIVNVGLRVNLEYADLDDHCKLSALIQPWRLAVEIRDGKVVRGKLKKTPALAPPFTYELTSEELNGLEIREEREQVWIKTLVASPELLRLLIYTGEGHSRDACVPPRGIANLSPEKLVFDFGIESVGHLLPTLLDSQEAFVRGETHTAGSYRIKLSLVQVR